LTGSTNAETPSKVHSKLPTEKLPTANCLIVNQKNMIIYNVTVKVDLDVHEEWLDWMRRVHIPDVLATGLFTDHRICRVLQDESDGMTYATQYFCESMKNLQEYAARHAKRLQDDHTARYKDKYVAFRTVMEVL